MPAAIATLFQDAADVCQGKFTRTRQELVSLLKSKSIQVRSLRPEETRLLDTTRDLLTGHHVDAAGGLLDKVEDLLRQRPEPRDTAVLRRLHLQRAEWHRKLDRNELALKQARLAIDLDPGRVDGYLSAGRTCLLLGNWPEAKSYSDRALEVAPGDEHAWELAAYVADATGLPLSEPPPSVLKSESYRLAQSQIASGRQAWEDAICIARGLLQDGYRSAEILSQLARALHESAGSSADPTAVWTEAEARASEAIELCTGDADPRLHLVLSIRSFVRLALGKTSEADEDSAHLRECVGDTPDVINNAAVRRFQAGDFEGALAELRLPKVQEHPDLLLLRAQVEIAAGRRDAAHEDFIAAMALIQPNSPAQWRALLADLAHQFGEVDLAERTIAALDTEPSQPPLCLVVKGRIAFAKGEVDKAEPFFRRAAELDPAGRAKILVELGVLLRNRGRPESAVTAFNQAGGAQLPRVALPAFATSLFEANKLAELKALLEGLDDGSPPTWALPMLVEIALRSEDPDAAILALRKLSNRPDSRAIDARVELARLLAETGRTEDARQEIQIALARGGADPTTRMAAAQTLASLGERDVALSEALMAYRLAPQDPHLNRALLFIRQALVEQVADQNIEVGHVEPGTHVTLEDTSGKRLEYTIYQESPVDPCRSELLATDAQRLGLLGKTVGDTIVQNEGQLGEKRWTVLNIKTALAHVVGDIYEHYEERFPGEPFLVGFSLPEGGTVAELTPLIRAVHDRKRHQELVLDTYSKNPLPLGWAAKQLRLGVNETIAMLLSFGPQTVLQAEWPPGKELTETVDAARGASELVLTASALATAEALGLLERVLGAYRVVLPRTLVGSLRRQAQDAERSAAVGSTSVGDGPAGLAIHKIDPGDARLVQNAAQAQARLALLSAKAAPRPLAMIPKPGAPESELRENIGPDSWDALELAAHRNSVLWADDLGLRIVPQGGVRVRSCSTIVLLCVMAERGLLAEEECFKHLRTLIRSKYRSMFPWARFLDDTAVKHTDIGRAETVGVFETLTGLPSTAAAQAFAGVLRRWAVSPIRSGTLDSITRMGLEALAKAYPPALVARQLADVAPAAFALLPRELGIIQRVCADFAKNRPPTIAPPDS